MNLFYKLFIENFHETFLYNLIKDFLFPLFLALISVITAYYFFFRQILNDNQKMIERKKEELKDKLTYFSLIVHNAIQNSKEQNKNLRTLITELEGIEIDSRPQFIAPITDLKNIVKKIDIENYLLSFLEYYSSGNKIENAGKFKTIIDSCGMIYQIFLQNDKFLEDKLKLDSEGKIKLSAMVNECANLLGKCLHKMHEEKNPLFPEFIKINDDANRKMNSYGDEFLRGQYYLILKPCLALLDLWNTRHIAFDEDLGSLWITTKDGVELYNNMLRNNILLLNHLKINFEEVENLVIDIETSSQQLREDFL